MSDDRQYLNTAYQVALWRQGCFDLAFAMYQADPVASNPGWNFEQFWDSFAPFARDYRAPAELTPMPGDAVRLGASFDTPYWKTSYGAVAVLNGVVGRAEPSYSLTCRAQEGGAFRDAKYVSASGGPCFDVAAEELTLAGNYHVEFWRWGAKGAGAGGSERYRLLVPLWELDRAAEAATPDRGHP